MFFAMVMENSGQALVLKNFPAEDFEEIHSGNGQIFMVRVY